MRKSSALLTLSGWKRSARAILYSGSDDDVSVQRGKRGNSERDVCGPCTPLRETINVVTVAVKDKREGNCYWLSIS